MAEQHSTTLRRLADSNLTVAFPDEDAAKVRFFEVASGGLMGIGETKVLIPVDAVTAVTDEAIRVDQTHENVAGAPAYDPTLPVRSSRQRVYVYPGYPRALF